MKKILMKNLHQMQRTADKNDGDFVTCSCCKGATHYECYSLRESPYHGMSSTKKHLGDAHHVEQVALVQRSNSIGFGDRIQNFYVLVEKINANLKPLIKNTMKDLKNTEIK